MSNGLFLAGGFFGGRGRGHGGDDCDSRSKGRRHRGDDDDCRKTKRHGGHHKKHHGGGCDR